MLSFDIMSVTLVLVIRHSKAALPANILKSNFSGFDSSLVLPGRFTFFFFWTLQPAKWKLTEMQTCARKDLQN